MGKAATKAKNKYNDANYDRVSLVVPKGKKDEYKARAEAAGKSLNQYIIDKLEGQGWYLPFYFLSNLHIDTLTAEMYDDCNLNILHKEKTYGKNEKV